MKRKINKEINELQKFFDADLYSKFKPEMRLNGKIWIREDYIKNTEEFSKYLNIHFSILRRKISNILTSQSD